MWKRTLTIACVLVVAVSLFGCGSNRDSDGTIAGEGTTLADADTVGITNCLTCHDNSDNVVTSGWLNSRHGNALDVDAKTALNDQGGDPAHSSDDQNSDGTFEGLPDYDLRAICASCHDALGDGRLIDDALVDENERPIVSCESCHGGGQFHNGIAEGVPFPTPGPDQCGQCHGVTEPLFHSSDRGNDAGNARRNITDTHDDLASTVGVVEGYVVKTSEQTGCVDCHYSAHDFDLTINNQWAESGHAGHLKTIKENEIDSQLASAGEVDLDALKAAGTDSEVFIHASDVNGWDNVEEVACQRCHTATGGMNFLNDPASYEDAVSATGDLLPRDPTQEDLEAAAEVAPNDYSHLANWTAEEGSPETELIYCWTCHSDSDATFRDPGSIPFPSGVSQSLSSDGSNTCLACHQGRASGVTVENNIADGDFGFVNRHYLAAAAIMYGTDVTAGVEYRESVNYNGLTEFIPHTENTASSEFNTCAGCHLRRGTGSGAVGDPTNPNDHNFLPELSDCNTCHTTLVTDFDEMGPTGGFTTDYDGDGTPESWQDEITGMGELLLSAMQTYADNEGLKSIGYDGTSYPYWFIDTDGNGTIEDDESSYGNQYDDFDGPLLRAAYNYHSAQDPCGNIHNFRYVLQTLYDSIDDMNDQTQNNDVQGTSVAATRP